MNAAEINTKGASTEFPIDSWDRALEINLTAVFELCKFACQLMVEQKQEKIINIGSITSFTVHINGAHTLLVTGQLCS